MFKNLVKKIIIKKNNDENNLIKKTSFITSFIDLENIIEEKEKRYVGIEKTKIFNNGGFDQILKLKFFKNGAKTLQIKRNFDKKFSFIKFNEINKKRHRKKKIIYPDSKLYSYINIIVGIAILYSVTYIPYEMAFLINEYFLWSIILEYILDFIFLIDLLHNFFTAYYDRNFNLIDDFKKIVMNYIFGWFLLDLISSIPFSLIDINSNSSLNPNFTKLARFAKLPKILKVFRFAKLIKKFGDFKKQAKKNNNVIINPAFERLFITLFLVSIFLHLLACLWYISATWFFPINNWVYQLGYWYKSNIIKYIASIYWVVQTVFTVGYGDIPAYNSFERFLAIISMFLGVFIYSFVVGSFSSLFFSINSHLAKKKKSLEILYNLKKRYKLTNSIFKETKFIIEKNL